MVSRATTVAMVQCYIYLYLALHNFIFRFDFSRDRARWCSSSFHLLLLMVMLVAYWWIFIVLSLLLFSLLFSFFRSKYVYQQSNSSRFNWNVYLFVSLPLKSCSSFLRFFFMWFTINSWYYEQLWVCHFVRIIGYSIQLKLSKDIISRKLFHASCTLLMLRLIDFFLYWFWIDIKRNIEKKEAKLMMVQRGWCWWCLFARLIGTIASNKVKTKIHTPSHTLPW